MTTLQKTRTEHELGGWEENRKETGPQSRNEGSPRDGNPCGKALLPGKRASSGLEMQAYYENVWAVRRA